MFETAMNIKKAKARQAGPRGSREKKTRQKKKERKKKKRGKFWRAKKRCGVGSRLLGGTPPAPYLSNPARGAGGFFWVWLLLSFVL